MGQVSETGKSDLGDLRVRCLDNTSRDNAIITSEFRQRIRWPVMLLNYTEGVLTAYYESVTVLG